MKILVLGGSGFLGSHVCDQLLSKGHTVTILDKKSFYTKNKKINYFKVDLNNSKNLEKYFKNQDHVINFSGLADINKTDNKPLETIHQNLLPMVNTYLLSVKYNLKSYIFASTVYVNSFYGNFYKSSKICCEEYLVELEKKYKLPYKILRYGSLYGPRSDNSNGVYKVISNILNKKKIIFEGPKNTTRSYIHVLDAARATVEIIDKKFNRQKINITGRESKTYEEIGRMLQEIFDIRSEPKYKQKKISKNHYKITPYNYENNYSMKYSPNYSIELEEGIINFAKSISN